MFNTSPETARDEQFHTRPVSLFNSINPLETAVDRIVLRLLKPHLSWSAFSEAAQSINYGSFEELDTSISKLIFLKRLLPFAVPGDIETYENDSYLGISVREEDAFEIINDCLTLEGRSLDEVARELRARGESIAIFKADQVEEVQLTVDTRYCDGNILEEKLPLNI